MSPNGRDQNGQGERGREKKEEEAAGAGWARLRKWQELQGRRFFQQEFDGGWWMVDG